MPSPTKTRKPAPPRAIVAISLPVTDLADIDRAAASEGKGRSELVRDLTLPGVRRILRQSKQDAA